MHLCVFWMKAVGCFQPPGSRGQCCPLLRMHAAGQESQVDRDHTLLAHYHSHKKQLLIICKLEDYTKSTATMKEGAGEGGPKARVGRRRARRQRGLFHLPIRRARPGKGHWGYTVPGGSSSRASLTCPIPSDVRAEPPAHEEDRTLVTFRT